MHRGGVTEQIAGRGQILRDEQILIDDVGYWLDLSDCGTLTGTLTAPPFERLTSVTDGPGDFLLLRLEDGRLAVFTIRAYERHPGGSAQIAGRALTRFVAAAPTAPMAA